MYDTTVLSFTSHTADLENACVLYVMKYASQCRNVMAMLIHKAGTRDDMTPMYNKQQVYNTQSHVLI